MSPRHQTSGLPISTSAATPSSVGMENCTCFNLRKAARAVTQFYDAVLQPSGMKTTQFTVLAVARRLGPVPVTRLAHELVMDRTTLTRNLRPLKAHGWIRILPGEDRRARMVEITPSGRDVLADAIPLWRDAQSRLVNGLGTEEWRDLLARLRTTVSFIQPG